MLDDNVPRLHFHPKRLAFLQSARTLRLVASGSAFDSAARGLERSRGFIREFVARGEAGRLPPIVAANPLLALSKFSFVLDGRNDGNEIRDLASFLRRLPALTHLRAGFHDSSALGLALEQLPANSPKLITLELAAPFQARASFFFFA